MAIPEAQLDTWSHQGSITQSRDTYATVKRALETSGSPYAGKVEIFLQGSYCNDTNIFAESDVDLVIRLNVTYHYELLALDAQERATFQATFIPATYPYAGFKKDVLKVLEDSFPGAVHPGPNAIKIDANGTRRSADVLVATDFRNYRAFPVGTRGIYPHGICFFNGGGEQIVNYPKLHSENCTAKHQSTNGWFKPIVRIFKNARGRLESDGLIPEGAAPSYYVEGLLSNVPDDKFGGSYQKTVIEAFNWIIAQDRSTFTCGHKQTQLLGNSKVSWEASKCDVFLDSFKKLWTDWR